MRAAILILLLAGATAVAAPLLVRPAAHDFGQAVVQAVVGKTFTVSVPAGVTPGGSISATITGPDDADFVLQAGSCTGWPRGSCTYDVDFRPTTAGSKTATLEVTDSRGNRGSAALSGEGIKIECRPVLVTCNYFHLYEGRITIENLDSTVVGQPLGQTMRDRMSLAIEIDGLSGRVTCDGTVHSISQTWDGNRMTSQTTGQGTIQGPGYFALEFVQRGGQLEYRMSFACPRAHISVRLEEYIPGYPAVTTRDDAAEDADPRDLNLAFDPQPATRMLQDTLKGRQTDLRQPMGDDTGGITTVTWNLERIR